MRSLTKIRPRVAVDQALFVSCCCGGGGDRYRTSMDTLPNHWAFIRYLVYYTVWH